MKRIRTGIAILCLGPSLLAPAQASAGAIDASPGPAAALSGEGNKVSRLDLTRYQPGNLGIAAEPSTPGTPMPLKSNLQAGNGTTRMSAAKKTWIIVGSIVGAALVVAAVSNHGGGGGGGGGY